MWLDNLFSRIEAIVHKPNIRFRNVYNKVVCESHIVLSTLYIKEGINIYDYVNSSDSQHQWTVS